MSDEKRRAHNMANATLGVGLTAGGGALSQAVGRHGSRKARIAAQIVPRGLSAVGVPIAATGIVGAARGKGRVSNVQLQHLPGQVARSTVALPKDPRKAKSERAKDAAAATLAGGLGGLVGSNAGHSPRARVVAGTIGSVATASGMLYGRQKGREEKRRVEKAEKKQKTFRMPVPSALDTRDDWKTYNQRRRTANSAMLATGVGAGALAARTPHLIRPKKPGHKLLKIRSGGDRASEVLGAAAGITGIYSAVTGYRTNQHDLNVQQRRLRQRDALLGRRSPVNKDAFTRKYGKHISPEAEAGYNYLRRGRNKRIRQSAASTAMTAVNAHAAIHGGKILRPVGIGFGVLTSMGAVQSAQGAKRWNGHMKKIRAKAYERAAAGEYGRGREVAPDELAKALLRVRPSGLPFPKGLRRAPALRPGGVRRTAGGKMVAFRGTYG